MKVLIIAALLFLPLAASADHLDVIQMELKEGCSLEKVIEIAKDFNEKWGKDYGYRAEIAVGLQTTDLTSLFWMGRSANAQAFGKAWDAWRDALPDSKTVAAKLQVRFDACTTNVARYGYDLY